MGCLREESYPPGCPSWVLSLAGGEIVVWGLTHPHVLNTQPRTQGGMGLGVCRKRLQGQERQQWLCEQRQGGGCI